MKALPLTILLFPAIATAQLSGYLSTSYGFNGNPLYNYEQTSDQISQSYIELHHESDFDYSSLDFGYTGGLMLYNHLADRNFYEHSLSGRWNVVVREDDEDDGKVDSAGAYLASELKFTGRYDKSAFEVYDNGSGGLNVSYRTMVDNPMFMRFTNKAEYRSYTLVPELSNITDILAVSLGSRRRDRVSFEFVGSIGLKHYTTTLTDTSTYTTITPTGSGTGSGNGHGHGKGNGVGNGGSTTAPGFVKNQHLYVTAESNTSWQYAIGGLIEKQWEKSSLQVGLVYRSNPTTVRYVAQYVNTSTLSEDIYNDHFAYEGPEAGAKFTQAFPFRINSTFQLQLASRTYSAPALSLDGVQTADKRKDTQVAFEVTFSKPFTLFGGVDLELNLTGAVARNQSNDEYNNYSASAVALGVGIGF